jgi:hypothetical protein
MYEDILITIGVAGHQIAGDGGKRHITPVGGYGGIHTIPIPLGTIGGHRDTCRLPGLPVADKDVVGAVGITWNQVAGIGEKSHVAPVGRDSGPPTMSIPLHPVRSDRDAGCLACDLVMDEDI